MRHKPSQNNERLVRNLKRQLRRERRLRREAERQLQTARIAASGARMRARHAQA